MNSTQIDPSRYRTFWPRFGAAILDSGAIAPLNWIDKFIWNLVTTAPALVGWSVINLVANLAFRIGFVAKFGQTPGKMAAGVKIVSVDESQVNIKQAVLRDVFGVAITFYFGFLQVSNIFEGRLQNRGYGSYYNLLWLVGAAFFWTFLEFITMLTNNRRRAIHDFIAGTVVIKDSGRKSNGLVLLLALLVLLNNIVTHFVKDTNIYLPPHKEISSPRRLTVINPTVGRGPGLSPGVPLPQYSPVVQATDEWRADRVAKARPLTPSQSLSLDCTAARSMAEQTVCGNNYLIMKDKLLARFYVESLARLKADKKIKLIAAQRAWLKERDKACESNVQDCIGVYSKRTSTLREQLPEQRQVYSSADKKYVAIVVKRYLASRLDINDTSGNRVAGVDFGYGEGEHGYVIDHAAWTTDSKFFVFNSYSLDAILQGHDSQPEPVNFYDFTGLHPGLYKLDVLIGCVVVSDFALNPPDQVTIQCLQNSKQIPMTVHLAQLNK